MTIQIAEKKYKADFELITEMDRQMLRKMLKKVNVSDLIVALTGADRSLKEALLGNLPGKLRVIAETCIDKMENGNIPGFVIKRSREMVNRALVELSMD